MDFTLGGVKISPNYVRDPDGGNYWDYDNAINNAGFLELKDPGLDWFRSSGQGNFANPTDYWKWVYGGGNVVSGPNGMQYFQTPRGVGNFVNTPLSYEKPEPGVETVGPLLVGGIAGAGLLAGAGAGAATAGVPESYWSMLADAGTGTATDAGVSGGLSSGGGFDLFNPSTWTNPFSNVPPGTTTLGQQLFDTGSDPSEFSPTGGDKSIFGGGMDAGSGSGVLSGLLGGNNWLNALGSLGGGLLQYLASGKASDAQESAVREAIAAQLAMYNQNRADLEPWRTAGGTALTNLGGLLGLPGYESVDFTKSPGYDFRYQQGLDDLNTRLRAAGQFYSGNALKAGQEYAQNFATNEFTNAINRDLALAGLGQTAVNTGVTAGQNTVNQVANSLTDIGNARASGYVGGANAITGGLGSFLNNYNQQNLLNMILGRGY